MPNTFLHLGVTQSSEVLAWDMETLNGALIKDLSGNGKDGTLSGAPLTTLGAWGQGRTFNGSSDSISAGNNGNMLSTDWSVSIWLKTSSATLQYAISKRDPGTSTNAGWAIRVNANGTVSAEHCDGSGAAIVATSAGTIGDGVFHNIIATWTRTGNLQIYIDNVADGFTSISAQQASSSNAVNLYVGRNANAAPSWFNGTLDEAYVFSRVLTTAEVKAIAKAVQVRLVSPDGTQKIPL